MFVKQFLTGGDRNYGYLAADETSQQTVVIDPSYSPKMIVDFAKERGYTIKYIFCTHNHYDHTNGNAEIRKLTGKNVLLYGDVEMDGDQEHSIVDDTRLPLGQLEVRVIHTPGHTDDSICLYIGDAVFTGDTLFVGKVGGTDFGEQAHKEYQSLWNKLIRHVPVSRRFCGFVCGCGSR